MLLQLVPRRGLVSLTKGGNTFCMKKNLPQWKVGPLCFCGDQGINESKHSLVRQILPFWEIKYDSVACLFLKARNLKMNLFFYCAVWWDMDSFVWRVFSLWFVAHEQISTMESHKGFCCHSSDKISFQHLPKGAVWTPRDGVFRHPEHHPFSTPKGRYRLVFLLL